MKQIEFREGECSINWEWQQRKLFHCIVLSHEDQTLVESERMYYKCMSGCSQIPVLLIYAFQGWRRGIEGIVLLQQSNLVRPLTKKHDLPQKQWMFGCLEYKMLENNRIQIQLQHLYIITFCTCANKPFAQAHMVVVKQPKSAPRKNSHPMT